MTPTTTDHPQGITITRDPDTGHVLIDDVQFHAELDDKMYQTIALLAELIARLNLIHAGWPGADVEGWFETLSDEHQGLLVLFQLLSDAAEIQVKQRLTSGVN